MMPYVLAVVACAAAGACAWCLARVVQLRLAAMRSRRRALTLEGLLRDKALSFLVFALAGLVVAWAVDLRLLPALLAVAYALSRSAPGFLERRRKRALRSACDGELDVMADIIAMGVRAGLTFDAALDLYCERFDGVLAKEMHAARLRWSGGIATREQALADAAANLGSRALRRLNNTVVQALRYGSPLAGMLAEFACELREERRASIERQVEKAPVKMLIPMGACILPAMLLLVLGPAVLQFLGTSL